MCIYFEEHSNKFFSLYRTDKLMCLGIFLLYAFSLAIVVNFNNEFLQSE